MTTGEKSQLALAMEPLTKMSPASGLNSQTSALLKDRAEDSADGVLTQAECEALRQAFLRGADGRLLIGLCGTRRIVTVMLPKVNSQESAIRQMTLAATRLKAMNCNGYVYARRAGFAVTDSDPNLKMVLIVRERQTTHLMKKVIWLEELEQSYTFKHGLEDAVTRMLDLILQLWPNPNGLGRNENNV